MSTTDMEPGAVGAHPRLVGAPRAAGPDEVTPTVDEAAGPAQ
ncbi:hypothetical protein [Streptomyces silvensis]|nr:hypothetical protein [Streptomyces silvensis]